MPVKAVRAGIRWVPAAAAAVLAPKCLLCVGAYASLAALCGFKAAPEICGGSNSPAGLRAALSLAVLAAAYGALARVPLFRRR